ncbi:helix-turn-helix domain-containing protein [Nonomuraea dietziae]|uniref:TetR/AcrR family transcriptional regulator n=1 Tax=Nonomuraea dietziae TaxID=65515 RepID=UPI0031D3DFA9
MGTADQVRERTILDATAELLLRIGYDKLTMGDVADAVSLHRGLVYLVFKSKDELVEAVVHDELSRYADAWREHLEADPRAGDVASVYRAMMGALKTLPLAARHRRPSRGRLRQVPAQARERLRAAAGDQQERRFPARDAGGGGRPSRRRRAGGGLHPRRPDAGHPARVPGTGQR